jgi:hypothetical protein
LAIERHRAFSPVFMLVPAYFGLTARGNFVALQRCVLIESQIVQALTIVRRIALEELWISN